MNQTNRQKGFTLLELIISVFLFLIAITIALYATVGTNSILARTEARSVLSEGGRTVTDVLNRLATETSVGAVEVLKVSSQSADYVGARMKIFSIDQRQKTCQVVGRAAPVMINDEQHFQLSDTGATMALWIYPLSDTNNCPDLGSATIYQNRLFGESGRISLLQFWLHDLTCASGCTLTQELRYRFRLETAVSLTGQTAQTKRPSIDLVSGLPIGLTTNAYASGSGTSLAVNTTALPNAGTGSNYSQTLQASGGVAPYAWSIVAGSLPPGISLNPLSGKLSGTPVNSGIYNFTARVTDNNSLTADQPLTLTVSADPLTITTTSLPNGKILQVYSQTLQATGGDRPYTWSVISGQLPTGLSLNATGTISGTPGTAGTFSFSVKATDSSATPQSATKNLTILIQFGSSGGPSQN